MSLHWTIRTLPQTSSTQDEIKTLASDGAPEGGVVHALIQKAGRGRHGRSWVSAVGNLFFSLLLRPECAPKDLGLLSLLVGLSTGRALRSFMREPEKLLLKWPNDILIDGHKCAGILLESEHGDAGRVAWVAVGIGVNLVSAPPDATCFKDYTQKEAVINEVRDAILAQIGLYYDLWRQGNTGQIRKDWLAMTCAPGVPVTVKTGGHSQQGHFHDIDADGNLLLLADDGRVLKITAGDVYL